MSETDREAEKPFELSRQSAAGVKREVFQDTEGRQRVLFAGADCLPGQGELWNADGRDGECPRTTNTSNT